MDKSYVSEKKILLFISLIYQMQMIYSIKQNKLPLEKIIKKYDKNESSSRLFIP